MLFYEIINKGKCFVGFNFKDECGCEILVKFIEGVDVLVENFWLGVFECFGFLEDWFCELQFELIYVLIIGFGVDGLYFGFCVYDVIVQVVFGMVVVQGNFEIDVFEFVCNLVCDKIMLFIVVQVIIVVLLYKVCIGKGFCVELFMFDVLIVFFFLDGFNNEMFLLDEELGDVEMMLCFDIYWFYVMKDGVVMLMIVLDKDWVVMC